MKRDHETTLEERLEIVQYALAHNKNYRQTSAKYNVSYSQVSYWVKKFEKGGSSFLIDHRKKKQSVSAFECLKLEVTRLEELNEELAGENAVLKKLLEIQRLKRS